MSTKHWPSGLMTAIVTPLKKDKVDPDALSMLIEHQIKAGVSGLVVSGGTGEYGALSYDERSALIRESVRLAKGRVPIIAATGRLTTADAIRLSNDAAGSGAAGLLVASPYGEPINWRERLAFYKKLTAAVKTPVMIYNTPPAGLLTFDEIRQLAELPNVSAVKDSSGNPELMGDLNAWARTNDFSVYVGKDSFLYEAISTGARGAVFGAANIIPELLVELISALRSKGSSPASLELWSRIRPFLRFTEVATNYVGLCKAGCKLRGIDVGEVRAPYMMPSAKEVEQLAGWLKTLKVKT